MRKGSGARNLMVFAILSLLAGSKSFGQTPQAEEQPRTARGTVINAVTQAPIPRALVTSMDNRFGMLTDSDGRFEFVLPKPIGEQQGNAGAIDLFRFVARKPGFLENANRNPSVEFSGAGDITIALVPESLIKGRVTLSTNDAADGVTVELFSRELQSGMFHWQSHASTRTNSAGEFRFSGLPHGSYKLLTHEWMDNDPAAVVPGGQSFGFPPAYFPGVADFSAASTIEVVAGQTVEANISLTRQPYFFVRIPVASADANNGMNVSVQGQRGPGYALGYNPGMQRIEGLLPSGSYVVEATSYGSNAVSGKVVIKVADGPLEGPTMTLAPLSSVNVNVKEEFNDSTPSPSATWTVGQRTFSVRGPRLYLQASVEDADDFSPSRGASMRAPTGPNDDSLVLENLTPGRYWLRLNSSRGYVAAATMGNVDLLREPFMVGSGASAPVEIRLRDDFAEVEGTVTGLAEKAAIGSEAPSEGHAPVGWVYLVPLPDSSGQYQVLGIYEGRFTHPNMTPGSYRVLAFTTQHPNLPYRDPEAMKAYESKGPVIQLAAGQKASVQVQLVSSSE
jgi:hypothetical protein